jgi:hypothetical protein
VLGADGSIQIAARDGFDPHAYTLDELHARARGAARRRAATAPHPRQYRSQGWKIVERFAGIAPYVGAGAAPDAGIALLR